MSRNLLTPTERKSVIKMLRSEARIMRGKATHIQKKYNPPPQNKEGALQVELDYIIWNEWANGYIALAEKLENEIA